VQALTTKTNFANPKRNANGFDLNRLQLLIAILSKHTSINLDNQDVYINVVGGMKISERSADLAVLSALASSHTKKPLDRETVFISEVGLTGELRQVTSLDKRIQELESLGVKKAIIPDHKKTKAKKATLQKCSFIAEVINMIKK
jgi:DNA repair protein RadA/Sms